VAWRSELLYGVADRWKFARDLDLSVAKRLQTRLDHWSEDSEGDTSWAAYMDLASHVAQANLFANYAAGVQLAYVMFAGGVDLVRPLVEDALAVAAEFGATINDDGSVSVPYVETYSPTLSPQDYQQARIAAVTPKVQLAFAEASRVDQEFQKALNDVKFGDGTTDPFGVPNVEPWTDLDERVAADDPLTPGENRQGTLGDCWLIAMINAMMETPQGRQKLRDGVTWDPGAKGYQVVIYRDGQPVTVLVKNPVENGVAINAGTSSGPGIASLYEAAVNHEYTHEYLASGTARQAIEIMTNQGPVSHFRHVADAAVASGGSASGSFSIASTPRTYPDGSRGISVQATGDPGSGMSTVTVTIGAGHGYEVVDIKDGMIGLRNPWGLNNRWDGPAQNAAGVFYISTTDFDRAITEVTTTQS